MSSSPANSCLLFCLQLRLSPTLLSSYEPYDDMIFMFMTHARDYRHPTTITTLRPVFLATLWEVPFGRSPQGPLWEVGGCLLFGPVHSPCPSSLALETFPEEQDFLWRYQHTLVCRTHRNRNRRPSSMADNPDLGLFGPPDGIAVFLIFYYYFSYLGPIPVTMITGDHQLPSISLAYTSLSLVHARLCIAVPYGTKHVQIWSVRIVRIVYQG